MSETVLPVSSAESAAGGTAGNGSIVHPAMLKAKEPFREKVCVYFGFECAHARGLFFMLGFFLTRMTFLIGKRTGHQFINISL